MKLIKFNVVFWGAILLALTGFAQTTLPGNSDVDGDFSVGNSTNKGGLTITGQTGNTAAPGLKVTGDGGVVFEGTLGTGELPSMGSGTRFLWYPNKSAVKIGDGTWDDEYIGESSFAMGSLATGKHSVALSNGAAHGERSMAVSNGEAYGVNSVALSAGTTYGNAATAMSGGNAYGMFSAALSAGYAIEYGSTAMSQGMTFGKYSTAAGPGTQAMAYGSFVVGQNNYISGLEDAMAPQGVDPLFIVGNGTGNPADAPEIQNSNALVVKRNGDVVIPKRQGDILMGEFGSPE